MQLYHKETEMIVKEKVERMNATSNHTLQSDYNVDTMYRIDQVLLRIPISRSLWYRLVKQQRAPQPVKLSARTSMWRKSEIDRFLSEAL